MSEDLFSKLDGIVKNRAKMGHKISRNTLLNELLESALNSQAGFESQQSQMQKFQNDLLLGFQQLSKSVDEKLDLTNSRVQSNAEKLVAAMNDVIDVIQDEGEE